MSVFALKLKTSLGSVAKVLATPSYGLLATVIGLVVVWLFLWLFNLDLLFSVLSSSNLNLTEKASFTLAGFQSLFTNFDSPQAVSLGVFGVLSGINLAVLIYVLRHGTVTGSAGSSNFVAAISALIGSGCAVCGGSILGPVAAIFGASLSASATRAIGVSANALGIILLAYSIYGLGKTAAQILARKGLSGSLYT